MFAHVNWDLMKKTSADIAKRETLTALVGTYQKAAQEIIQGYALLAQAQERLRAAYLPSIDYRFEINPPESSGVGEKASNMTLARIKRDAWHVLVERMELRRLLSVQRRKELDKQLEKDELPEITEENIVALMEQSAANLDAYLEEAAKELFEYLLPLQSRHKTNSPYELGRYVILPQAVEPGYGREGEKYRVHYHRDARITAIDNIFSLLDGKGTIKTYYGQLYDSIADSADGRGETAYFKFKCFQNGNLHLEFKRPDLVAALNKLAGGNRLK